MANPEHLAILEQGVEMWNRWREKWPEILPDLRGADLCHTDLRGVNLISADLVGADLFRVILIGANLRDAHFNSANLSRADLFAADLSGAELFGAILSKAGLWRSNLSETILQNADFTGARINRAIFTGTDLSQAKGLDSVKHSGPSYISIDTLYKSKGQIPESFLRGCGVPDTFITFARSLINAAIDFYSCFISYSSKNQAFAERLHADLQTKGVRCWFAPEEIKIGDKFRQRIDEAIRVHDKLLLILSEDSMASAWVEDEVEAALERERRENRLVLFPVCIDDAIEQSNKAWAASLRRMRHIGDFSRWKDHDSYSKAFSRLLRDLKAESTS